MKKTLIAILILILNLNIAAAQDSTYVTQLKISEEADDFAPFVWNDFLVFTSERQASSLGIEYKDSQHESGVSSLFKAKFRNDTVFANPELLSKYIQSNHHDGPASFTKDGQYIYYSRPHDIGNSARARNNAKNFLGIFKAEWDGNAWGNIEVLPFSDSAYICTHPAISPAGDFIVFATNMPGGKGKADLFISRKVGDQWSNPLPLDNKINTKKDDFFPYIHYNGDLYFASNRKGDYDIYYCKVKGDGWESPIALPEPINSNADDYSIFLDEIGSKGYFASNRNGAYNLFFFEKFGEELQCDSLVEESFCYTFPPIDSEDIEGLPLVYEWYINGANPVSQDQVVYCFPEAGQYSVKLNIVDTIVNKVIFTKDMYEFLVERLEQPYIQVPDSVRVNEWVNFNAEESYLPSISMEDFIWDFGDGQEARGEEVQHKYTSTGTYKVSLTIVGAPVDGLIPQFCSYKYIEVTKSSTDNSDVAFKDPLDLNAFIRLIEYQPLPEDLYYLDLIGNNDFVMMINFLNSDTLYSISDPLFDQLPDSNQIHVFENDDESFSYYYGASFSIREAYQDLVTARESGFPEASIINFKYTKLKNDEYFLSPMEDEANLFAVVLKKSKTPIENYKKEFKKVPDDLGEVREIYIEGEGYYYVVGNVEELNDAFSIYTELKFAGLNSMRIKSFKDKKMIALYDNLSPSQTTNTYMVELFKADNYLDEQDTVFNDLRDKDVLSLRIKKKQVAYYIEGGSSLLEAMNTLAEMKKRGFKDAKISNFVYEKLNQDGFYITKLDDGTFSYVLTFDSTETPRNIKTDFGNSLLAYDVFEGFDPLTKKFYYQVDVGQNLPEAVLLAKQLLLDSLFVQNISKLRYEPLAEDEFYLDELKNGDEQYVLVLGSYKEQQNVYKTFKGFSSCSDIREFYSELNDEYLYIAGGYENLEDVFVELDKCKEMGMEGIYIQKFVYDPLDPDQFYLQAVNEESQIFRITINRTDENTSEEKSTDEKYDDLRDEGELIDSYDAETEEFVVALGKSKSLPKALNFLGSAIEKGYSSAKVQRYIYSSMDQDIFVIRDLKKEDRYMCVELFHSDTLLSTDNPLLIELSKKYPIAYSYNEASNDYVYVIGPLENVDGALAFLDLAKEDGYTDARIKGMVFQTLAYDEFYLEEVKDVKSEFVLTILQSKNKIETNNVFFAGLPDGVDLSVLKDKESGYFYYLIRNMMNLNMADSLYSIITKNGYPNVRLELLSYDKLKPDDFSLETLSELTEDFTISLLRSSEKLGVDNEVFAEINEEAPVVEYYNYRTKEFIYSLGKVQGMINAFKGLELANRYGFDEATIDRFVYSTFNPDHFYLEPIDENDPLFTIILESGNKQKDAAYFKKIEDAGFSVREKYIPGMNRWTYSIGLTENIAEANRIAELAKQLGYQNAEISRFVYAPLANDNYYLTEMEDIATAFMLEIGSSEKPLNMDSSYFDNVKGVYGVSQVYDPNDKRYKYYVGKPIYNLSYAESFKNELIAMGYDQVRISKFVYSALKVDEYYLDPIELDDISFVLEDDDNFELFVYFGFDQYFLSDKALKKLDDFYDLHYNKMYQILLEGYTDSIGDADYNMWLSRKRALSVKKYLLKMGVPESNITLIAKGETDPIYIKPNVEDYKKSRRVLLRSYRKRE